MKNSDSRYNLIVVGGGSGGLMVAAAAAGMGARTALVEGGLMGGDCLNYGCVPSKSLLSLAARQFSKGLKIPPGASGEWDGVKMEVQKIIDHIAPHDSIERFTSLGVDVFQGTGSLVSKTEIKVQPSKGESVTLRGRAIVLATGSSPLVPPIPGLAEAGFLTNETIFNAPAFPKQLLVLGGGPIGVELGQAFAQLGAEVTLIEMAPQILPREDPEAAQVVGEALKNYGIRLLTGCRVVEVKNQGKTKQVVFQDQAGETQTLELGKFGEILVAAGRVPNTAGLGLENAGVAFGPGGITVNQKMQTTRRQIYACGDVAGPFLFTHTAGQQARVVVQNALMPFKARMDNRVIPSCVFTSPPLAKVGETPWPAPKGVRVFQVPFAGVDRAICEGDTQGFAKIWATAKGQILGATVVGKGAGEMIHQMTLAMHAKISLNQIQSMVHIYPTRSEIFRRMADEYRRAGFTPFLQKVLKAYFQWKR